MFRRQLYSCDDAGDVYSFTRSSHRECRIFTPSKITIADSCSVPNFNISLTLNSNRHLIQITLIPALTFSLTRMLDPFTAGTKKRGPHVALQQQLSINICCLRPTSAANPPAAALLLSIDGTDGRTTTDTRPLYDAYRILCGPRNNLIVGPNTER